MNIHAVLPPQKKKRKQSDVCKHAVLRRKKNRVMFVKVWFCGKKNSVMFVKMWFFGNKKTE
jgi:hypothetical protein